MNIQQLIENAKQSLNAPQHHHAFDESFESCIKCTACTAVCPVSRQNPNYPGPKQSGPDGERLRLKSAELYDEALKYCTNCKRCEIACPSDVKNRRYYRSCKKQIPCSTTQARSAKIT